VREKLNLLLEKHCVTIKNTVERVGEHLERARDDGADPQQAVEDAADLAHQLKGSSGTAGFNDICVAATALHDHLKDLSERGDTLLRPGLHRAMELYARLSSVSQAARPQSSALYLVIS
jgi:HPt (histidine-containing phosphotransfer) domain-containing protein